MSHVMTDSERDALLDRTIDLALANAEQGLEPFGALVWRDGAVLGEGVNTIHADADPTAHAEIAALRVAARTLGTPFLTGAVVVASGEPCVQCLAASAAADVARIVFAGPKELVPPLDGPPRPHLPRLQETLRAAWPVVTHVDRPRSREPFERFTIRRARSD